ncbi:MAG: hypothetical protein AVDCRST_MAG93-6972 [uncultured Chloroflexia bacterium]|uniref:Uncharacterized protein n=1 Tax=uncultured Chloroflexia bacterium TaxID=1672391 RepID=A0A6J4M1T4_9CHLR|nr:MAG: hypothetical protein AVDCRST_MAG93-6972 [uncultured Chloroflexia bacterium]
MPPDHQTLVSSSARAHVTAIKGFRWVVLMSRILHHEFIERKGTRCGAIDVAASNSPRRDAISRHCGG